MRVRGATCDGALAPGWLSACASGNDGAGIVPASGDRRRNVMVIDQGIDLSVAELRGRVAAAFTLECVTAPPPPAAEDEAGTTPGGGGDADGSGALSRIRTAR